MTNKAKVLSGVILSAVLSTGLYAKQCENKEGYKHHKNSYHMKKHGFNNDKIFRVFKQLNLSDSQKQQIKTIIKDSKASRKKINEAFSNSSFDKDKFIQIMKEKKENALKAKADTIQKVYEVLNSKQKEQFKTLIDLKAQK